MQDSGVKTCSNFHSMLQRTYNVILQFQVMGHLTGHVTQYVRQLMKYYIKCYIAQNVVEHVTTYMTFYIKMYIKYWQATTCLMTCCTIWYIRKLGIRGVQAAS